MLLNAHNYCTHVLVVSLQADSSNNLLRRIELMSGLVTTVAGSPTQATGYADGAGTTATFNFPVGIAIDAMLTFAVVVRGVLD